MCTSGGVDRSATQQASRDAEAARYEETLRSSRVEDGTRLIEALFGPNPSPLTMPASAGLNPQDLAKRQQWYASAQSKFGPSLGKFNDQFFNDRRNSFLSFYMPQLDEQQRDARDRLTFALNDAGLLNSTVAGDRVGKLQREYDTNRASVLADAENDVTNLKGEVANQRAAALSQLLATGDADRASNEALSRQQITFQSKPRYSPLGDIFGGVATGIGAFQQRFNDAAILQAAGLGPRSPRRDAQTTVN